MSATLDATGKATPNLSTLAVGKYTMTATYPGDGKQFQATQLSPPLTIIIPAPVTINVGPKPAGAAVGALVPIPVTVSGTGAGVCTGTITSTVTSLGAPVNPPPSLLTNGVGSVTFTPPAAGNYSVVVNYAPDGASLCAAGGPTPASIVTF